MSALVYVPHIRFKSTRAIYDVNHSCIGGRYNVSLPGWYTNVWRGLRVPVKLFLAPELTSRHDQAVGASDYLKKILYEKILNPKDGGSFILASLTNIRHQVYSRIILILCFTVAVYDKTGWPMLDMHLSYNPPSSWGILFRSEGIPKKFSYKKNSRHLLIPGGCLRKKTIM